MNKTVCCQVRPIKGSVMLISMNTVTNEFKPRVLVVIPTLGQRLDLLRETLNSVKAQAPVLFDIAMIYPLKNVEARRIADEFDAISIDDPGSLSSALNAGIDSAKPWHDFISWIGDDDLITPHSFETAINALDKDTDATLVYGYCDYINNDGEKIFTSRAGKIAPWLMTWGPNLVPCPGILFRLNSLQKAGPFDVNNKYSMDLDMLLRLRKIGKFVNTTKTLAAFRWHPTSTTVANREVSLREAEQVKRKYLPKSMQIIAPVWELPVRIATKIAAQRVNNLAKRSK